MQVTDAAQYGLFTQVQNTQGQKSAVKIEQTKAKDYDIITKEMEEILKKSLKKDRWRPMNLGDPANYTNKAIVNRWTKEKNKWLQVSVQNSN